MKAPEKIMKNSPLKDLIKQHRARLMRINGVVGIAAGRSKADPAKWCIQVYVTTDDWPEGLPHQLDGYDVELVKTPGFRATRRM